MGHDIKTIKEAAALVLRVWREASAFFLSIELCLMVLVAFATVAGVWLAVMGNALCLLPFGFAVSYVAARSVLHAKRKLAWPFI
jgi:glycopeptide antibiotics resistance protein